MRRIIILLSLLILIINPFLFSLGRREVAPEVTPVNPNWTLCITAFDVSQMSPAWQTAGDLAARNLVAALQNLGFRFRSDDEIEFYRDYKWSSDRAAVAKNLATRREERDRLIFRGDPEWRYERNLRTVEAQIAALEERLAEIDSLPPIVEEAPVFLLCQNNRNGIFPDPPPAGAEWRFTGTNNLDAFLTGTFSEFHGRVFLELSMYTRYSDSYSYTDDVLFSPDDFGHVLAEISDRLAVEISVIVPSTLLVHAEPINTIITVDGSLIGPEEERILSPGTVEVTAFAEHHQGVSLSLDLHEGELTELFFNLTPFALSAFEVNVPGFPGSGVFRGSLFLGETPLTVELYGPEYSYLSVVTPDGEVGTGIFRDNALVRGSAEYGPGRVDFFTAPPAHKEDQIVENARSNFYRSWGALWITLPVSMMAAGVAGNYIASNNHVIANNLYGNDPYKRQQISDRATFGNIVTYGTYALIGGAIGWTAFNIFRYLRASSGDATPIAIVPEIEIEFDIDDIDIEEEEEEP